MAKSLTGRTGARKAGPKSGRVKKRSGRFGSAPTAKTRPDSFERDSVGFLISALDELEKGYRNLQPALRASKDRKGMERVIREVADRMKDNYPYFHPLYAGQMMKPPHPVARAAYMLSMWLNPNNHALDGGKASSAMEKEAVSQIAAMFGWKSHLGHLTGGGTMANLEALWVSGRLNPGKKIVASEQAHYTHARVCSILGLRFETVSCDRNGRMDPDALERMLEKGDVGTVVATVGSTAIGAADPLPAILDLREKYGFRLHADAAYGGYFVLVDNLAAETRAVLDRIGEADSIVIDPHKHGLQPYGCGCVIFRNPEVARFYKHDSPYTYFTSKDLHLGEISVECSRAGASAVALWATQRLFPLVRGGEFAHSLEQGRRAALSIYSRLRSDGRFMTMSPPELDIVVWAPFAKSTGEVSQYSRRIFDAAAGMNLHLALADLPVRFFDIPEKGMQIDGEKITCIRSVLMKPEHAEWADRIWSIIDKATSAALGGKIDKKL